jgi:hypothetical protein
MRFLKEVALFSLVLLPAYSLAGDEKSPDRVGQIIIVGNDCTPQYVILDRLGFTTGCRLEDADLRAAERRLMPFFLVDPERGIEPTVMILDPDSGNEIKDILVNVQEKASSPFAIEWLLKWQLALWLDWLPFREPL